MDNKELEPVIEKPEDAVLTPEGYWEERGLMNPKDRNPNGKFGDPVKQEKCWELYVQSWRNGSPSGYKAAIAAGYSEATAHNIQQFKWFKERKDKLRRSKMMSNAERNLSRILNLDYSKIKILPDGTKVDAVDTDTLRIVADISKTIVDRLGKDVGYTTKTEVGGGMDSSISIKSVSYADPIEIEAQVVEEITNQETKAVEEVIKNEEQK